ncbi:cbb3-type cytochrome c oxidase subunit 3 [Aurantiacibacter sp. D1-12]|uniref:cbb3-type cytochrome c oxidase subunit 3 n=1 Tax=Aurantiacibacter sp. D1-12 TaxID=2993658 RepID=UPI00237C72DA|nr:cbb3-type cytochrome c oxidase subunit 3 [Aurantiacibacter sp. D1-12]MDE1467751.1 cbb3-type cytochrome c oxidase subunit 3 [Aurantiacibacter sp. D1-12]
MSFYETLRHFADSYALIVMFALFTLLCLYPFRPGAGERNHHAATSIFKGNDDGDQ